MRQINIHEAKTHLSQLVEDAARGDDIVIAKAGKPVARLVGIDQSRTPRRPGALKGRITIADDFDAPLPPEMLAEFEADL
jgi:prevent-host-death family protein